MKEWAIQWSDDGKDWKFSKRYASEKEALECLEFCNVRKHMDSLMPMYWRVVSYTIENLKEVSNG